MDSSTCPADAKAPHASTNTVHQRHQLTDPASGGSTQPPASRGITEKMIVHVMSGFREVCLVTAALPLATLLCCFIGAVVYQADEVHETHCRVFNVIPSISAITGVSPQRYFWRISIALHIGPRFLVAAAYHNQYTFLLNRQRQRLAAGERTTVSQTLISAVFWLHMIEVAALCGVTYVSNRENYPVHEKIFVSFMVCSLVHMIATIRLTRKLYPAAESPEDAAAPATANGFSATASGHSDREHARIVRQSLRWKERLFWLSIASTVGMVANFARHRWYCYDLAFSWFALCEYVIACSNLAFHCTAIWDFPGELLILARGTGKVKKDA